MSTTKENDFAGRPRDGRFSDPGKSSPIGIFDSGYGGLTVLREIKRKMPCESAIFVGDSAHFPYGPRDLGEVRTFVLKICELLVSMGCKLIVIACNTATAAGLKAAQKEFGVPIVGVVEPGSRAATHMTRNRKVGVIATQGTIDSNAYADAIHNLDAGIEVFSQPTPKLVDIAEAGLQFQVHPEMKACGNATRSSMIVSDRGVLDCDSAAVYSNIADEYLAPLREAEIDTLVLGCTHFPLIEPLIQESAGEDVTLVSSAEETAREVREILSRRGQLADCEEAEPELKILTTGESTTEFKNFGEYVMGSALEDVSHVDLWQ